MRSDPDPAVRPLERRDLERLVELCAEHAAYEQAPYDKTGKSERLAGLTFGDGAPGDGARLWIWVVDEGDGAVGFVSFSFETSTWEARRFLHMDCLYLRPEARNRGLGRRLLNHGAELARRHGVEEIQWQTPTWNRGAIRFYGRLGAEAKEKLRFTWSRRAWNAGL